MENSGVQWMTNRSNGLWQMLAGAAIALALAFMAINIKSGMLQFRDADRVVRHQGAGGAYG